MELTSTVFTAKAIYVGVIFAITLGVAAYSTYFERIFAAFFQDRVGPDRAGPFGILQPLADAVKMFMKEDFIPANSSKWLFILGPCLSMFTALMTSAVIPFGDTIDLGNGVKFDLQGIDVNIGILWVFGIVSLGVYGILVGGWASNNKYSLLGAIRAASQNISYELAMGLSIISILMMTGSLSTKAIVEAQQNGHWNILYQPVGFILFIICAFAECNRTPFDLPECETELIGGYHTEYSSMKLGFYLFAEYINMFVSGAVMATLYFGGYDYPFYETVVNSFGENVANFIGFGALIGKALFFVFVFMWVRWTLPRFRYDQLMNLGWTGLIPIAMFNVVWTGLIILLPAEFNLSSLASIGIAIAGIPVLIVGLFIYHSIAGGKKKKTALAR
ncbi:MULTISPECIES: NADH-quinone oxidoreductase subunit NuoH [Flectobacillus]|jgi:NADH-quinone oxidoreductase subunit H|uniref:NADH-quinone oxidoreductase subunit H n=1 Tax=Flectobacillus roseus TaxID=502259 RepID=A0ABT6YD87_9BACT|nr:MULTISPECIES: NADH-quinone oxidoreductase subunit NuoH [Flectobacillus]MDI9861073.1 NADH-quinone oxidoreductase subunit NuoH [Flectobacillus roseus]MDI9870266.1 NADH-quinone oxidoreductase subunit NuoH [Flectobacillus roseus]PAC32093.1 NADH-quinone oxidoreductase subunit H [Flectobacillus sp. BAB-3569]